MKVLLSAHKDLVMNNYRFNYNNGVYTGLLDNTIGVLACNSLMLEEPNLIKLEKIGDIGLFFGSGEEWALHDDFPKVNKDTLIIVVDVASGNQYKNIDFSLENISGIKKERVLEIKEHLEWEGMKLITKMYNGNPDDEDEAWQWKELGYKVISFIIPIDNGNKDTGWHVDNCTISIEKINKCKHGLKRLINILL